MCKPAPILMKVFQGNSTTINPEKKVFQDFTVTGGTTGSNFDLKLSVVGKNEPMIPEVWPRSLNIVAGKHVLDNFSSFRSNLIFTRRNS